MLVLVMMLMTINTKAKDDLKIDEGLLRKGKRIERRGGDK
jgi:hypothetical protein